MVDSAKWKQLKQHTLEAFEANGRLDVHELEQIIRIGCSDGEFNKKEKAILVKIISNLTRADLDDAMWAKVAELIIKFELDGDAEATIEKLEDEEL